MAYPVFLRRSKQVIRWKIGATHLKYSRIADAVNLTLPNQHGLAEIQNKSSILIFALTALLILWKPVWFRMIQTLKKQLLSIDRLPELIEEVAMPFFVYDGSNDPRLQGTRYEGDSWMPRVHHSLGPWGNAQNESARTIIELVAGAIPEFEDLGNSFIVRGLHHAETWAAVKENLEKYAVEQAAKVLGDFYARAFNVAYVTVLIPTGSLIHLYFHLGCGAYICHTEGQLLERSSGHKLREMPGKEGRSGIDKWGGVFVNSNQDICIRYGSHRMSHTHSGQATTKLS